MKKPLLRQLGNKENNLNSSNNNMVYTLKKSNQVMFHIKSGVVVVFPRLPRLVGLIDTLPVPCSAER